MKKEDDFRFYGDEIILVVDDEDKISKLFINNLKFYGYNVILASNGEECVKIYKDNYSNIDLIT